MEFLVENYHASWNPLFASLKEELKSVDEELSERSKSGEIIYPPREQVFHAFSLTPLEKVEVVIVGQDPYHGEGEAQGFSFSVPNDIKRPPSLRNIFIELQDDLAITAPIGNDLSSWAEQGVLLLNASLTVAKDTPASHKKVGWDSVTDQIITKISSHCEHVVFILWGKFAESKLPLVDAEKHHIIVSPHPSPFSARRGFFGSKPFSKANQYLTDHQRSPISWSIA